MTTTDNISYENNSIENNSIENNINTNKWAVCLYSGLYSVLTDVVIDTWPALKQKLMSPPKFKVPHKDFLAYKADWPEEHKRIKFGSGLYSQGLSPTMINKDGKTLYSSQTSAPAPATYSVISMDYDAGVPSDFVDRVKKALDGHEYLIHTTACSTPENPRWRIVIPLAVPVDADTRSAGMHCLAETITWAGCDKAVFDNKRRMACPIECEDQTTQYVEGNGAYLDLTAWLDAHYPDWHDYADLPKSPAEKEDEHNAKTNGSGALTPLAYRKKDKKHGLINAFLKAYTCHEIIERSGLYQLERSNEKEERWSRKGDHGGALVIYANDTCKCYYASDILGGGKPAQNSFGLWSLLYHPDKDIRELLQILKKDQRVLEALRGDVEVPPEAEIWKKKYDDSEEGVAQRCMEYYPHVRCNDRWWRYDNGIYHEVKDAALKPDVLRMIRICCAASPDNEKFASYRGVNKYAVAILQIWTGLAEEKAVTIDDFETFPNYVHFSDGVLDLERFAKGDKDCLIPHSPEYMMTETTGYAWADVITAPQWAVDEIDHGMQMYQPDAEMRKYIWMALGRALSMDAVEEDLCPWLMGPEGGNGKSTLMYAIKGALGSYFYSLKASVLYKHRNDDNGEGPQPAVAMMVNKRFVEFEEFDYLRSLNTQKYKQYTSAGHIQVHKMRIDDNSFDAKCCCYIDSNGMPGVDKMEGALERRTRVIPFSAVLAGDGSIRKKWRTDKDIHHAMMQYLLRGYCMWLDNGKKLDGGRLHPETWPEPVRQETYNWFNAFDRPETFFTDYLEITHDENDYIHFPEVWAAYRDQLVGKGSTEHQLRMELGRWLKKQGLTEKRRKQVGAVRPYVTIGVRLRQEEQGGMCTTGQYSYRNNIRPIYERGVASW